MPPVETVNDHARHGTSSHSISETERVGRSQHQIPQPSPDHLTLQTPSRLTHNVRAPPSFFGRIRARFRPDKTSSEHPDPRSDPPISRAPFPIPYVQVFSITDVLESQEDKPAVQSKVRYPCDLGHDEAIKYSQSLPSSQKKVDGPAGEAEMRMNEIAKVRQLPPGTSPLPHKVLFRVHLDLPRLQTNPIRGGNCSLSPTSDRVRNALRLALLNSRTQSPSYPSCRRSYGGPLGLGCDLRA